MKFGQRVIISVFLVLFGNHLSGQIRVVNLAGDYIQYYHATENVSDEQKLECFNTMVFQKAPHVYERIFNDIKWIGQNPKERIISYRTGFTSIESKFSNLSDTLAIQVSTTLEVIPGNISRF